MHWAEHYIGRPWVSGESGPAAFDCWGLVRAVYADHYGLFLPAVDVDAASPLAVRRALSGGAERDRWYLVHLPADGDVVLMGHAQHPHHVGLWLDCDGGGILHSVRGAGVVFSARPALAASGWNIHGFYRRGP